MLGVESELWTCFTCCQSLVYDISCLLGGPVNELFDLCPLSLTVVDTEPCHYLRHPPSGSYIYLNCQAVSEATIHQKNKTIKLMIKDYPV